MTVIINCKHPNAEYSHTYYEVERVEVKSREVTIKQKDDVPHVLYIPDEHVIHIVQKKGK